MDMEIDQIREKIHTEKSKPLSATDFLVANRK
jgi:hypothetical protein